jgi:hypothetical protein
VNSENDRPSAPAVPALLAGLVGAVQAAGGNLAAAARRLGIPRDTVVSRLRKHGLLQVAKDARERRRREDERALRASLEEVPPSERVRVLLAPAKARVRLLAELATRADLDEDARALLREARVGALSEAA